MDRKVNIEEIRKFFKTCDKQFAESGITLQNVHFLRNEDNTLKEIRLSYEDSTEKGVQQ